MSLMNHAEAYFNHRASLYDLRSSSGLWKQIRTYETRALTRLLGPLIGVDALDLGCGTGFYAEKMRARGAKVMGVDSSAPMIEELKKKGFSAKKQNAAALSLNRKFRVILAAGLIEFLEDEERFFRLAHAHCQADGRLVMLVPRSGLVGWLYRKHHKWGGCRIHIRSLEKLEKAAVQAGFRLDKIRPAGPLALALRFLPMERGLA